MESLSFGREDALGGVFGPLIGHGYFDQAESGTTFTSLLGWVNIGLLSLFMAMLMYLLYRSIVNSAYTGRIFGGRGSAFWGPIRVILAISLFIPIPGFGGMGTAQLAVISLTSFGIKAGNEAAKIGVGFATFGASPLTAPPTSINHEVLGQVIDNWVCMETFRGVQGSGNPIILPSLERPPAVQDELGGVPHTRQIFNMVFDVEGTSSYSTGSFLQPTCGRIVQDTFVPSENGALVAMAEAAMIAYIELARPGEFAHNAAMALVHCHSGDSSLCDSKGFDKDTFNGETAEAEIQRVNGILNSALQRAARNDSSLRDRAEELQDRIDRYGFIALGTSLADLRTDNQNFINASAKKPFIVAPSDYSNVRTLNSNSQYEVNLVDSKLAAFKSDLDIHFDAPRAQPLDLGEDDTGVFGSKIQAMNRSLVEATSYILGKNFKTGESLETDFFSNAATAGSMLVTYVGTLTGVVGLGSFVLSGLKPLMFLGLYLTVLGFIMSSLPLIAAFFLFKSAVFGMIPRFFTAMLAVPSVVIGMINFEGDDLLDTASRILLGTILPLILYPAFIVVMFFVSVSIIDLVVAAFSIVVGDAFIGTIDGEIGTTVRLVVGLTMIAIVTLGLTITVFSYPMIIANAAIERIAEGLGWNVEGSHRSDMSAEQASGRMQKDLGMAKGGVEKGVTRASMVQIPSRSKK